MEIWIDTANDKFIEKIAELGITTGVTTNPSIASISNYPLEKLISILLQIQDGYVAVQVIADDYEGIVQQAQILHAISPRIVVKIPVIQEGLKAIKALSQRGVNTLATAIFEPSQALLAFLAGANYLAPYLGKIEDLGKDPLEVLEEIQAIKELYGFEGKIMAAGIRGPSLITECAKRGICAVTVPEGVLRNYLDDNTNTLAALLQFSSDWEKAEPSDLLEQNKVVSR
ncbi:MAG: transaldolase family protein [Parachlamydiales bacterium]|jgi:transaldolase